MPAAATSRTTSSRLYDVFAPASEATAQPPREQVTALYAGEQSPPEKPWQRPAQRPHKPPPEPPREPAPAVPAPTPPPAHPPPDQPPTPPHPRLARAHGRVAARHAAVWSASFIRHGVRRAAMGIALCARNDLRLSMMYGVLCFAGLIAGVAMWLSRRWVAAGLITWMLAYVATTVEVARALVQWPS